MSLQNNNESLMIIYRQHSLHYITFQLVCLTHQLKILLCWTTTINKILAMPITIGVVLFGLGTCDLNAEVLFSVQIKYNQEPYYCEENKLQLIDEWVKFWLQRFVLISRILLFLICILCKLVYYSVILKNSCW